MIDLKRLTKIFQLFSKLTGITAGLVDCQTGQILIKTGWTSACENFHRANPHTKKLCLELNKQLNVLDLENCAIKAENIHIKTCPNGLYKGVKPLYFNNIHLGNMFIGQLLFEEPNQEYFLAQAYKYGFEPTEYLKAIKEVPVFSQEKVMDALMFLDNMASFIVDMGLQNLDIFEKKEELAKSKQLFRTISDCALDWIFWRDTEGKLIYNSPAFEKITGYSLDELKDNPGLIEHLIWQKDKDKWQEHKKEYHPLGNPQPLEIRIVNKQGQIRWLRHSCQKIYSDENVYLGIRGSNTDITLERETRDQLKQMEHRLWQSQSLESLGTLAGGIAHDFNNILAAISGYTELSMEDLPANSATKDNLQEVQKACFRAKELIKQILTFSSYKKEERQPIDAELILKDTLKLLRPTIPSTIAIRFRQSARQTKILANPTQFHQVIMNLCINACQAMEQGGRLDITMEERQLNTNTADQFPGLVAGRYLEIAVQDSGNGIDQQVINRIFQPFFSTKEVGEGRGMGLALAHGIIKVHQGYIDVESKVGVGSIFKILLPLIDDGEVCSSSAISNNKKILLVDDEESIVKLLSRFLIRRGYKVDAITDSTEALQLFLSRPDEYALAIIDQTMPRLTGEELSKKILATCPTFPIIICTGYSSKFNPEQAKKTGIKEYFYKPISLNELAMAIEKILN